MTAVHVSPNPPTKSVVPSWSYPHHTHTLTLTYTHPPSTPPTTPLTPHPTQLCHQTPLSLPPPPNPFLLSLPSPAPPPPPLSLTLYLSLFFFFLSSMATPPSSPPPQSTPPSDPPSAVPLALPIPPPITTTTTTSSRRLPPPCWSPDETLALIDAYRDKWYSLGRGNLKATHWQEVADAVAQRCPNATPPKTPVQCRHKMEKLRKRYRTEIQRARSLPVARFNSSWVHFKLMDSMEKGPSSAKTENNDSDSHDGDGLGVDRDDDDDDQDIYEELKNGHGSNTRSLNRLYRNGFSGPAGGGNGSGGGGGFRIRIPTGLSVAPPGSKLYGKVGNQKFNNPNLNQSGGSNFATRVLGKRERERETDPVGEVVSAIKMLGDGFVRMEQMKMEMAREIEAMRMDMEMKRTEMILESQQRIVEAFAKAVSDKKKAQKAPSPQQS